MSYDIRDIRNIDGLIKYFISELNWNIDLDDFDEIDDITYDFDASDIGLKDEAFAKIKSLRQLQPISDYQKWGIFCVEFDSDNFVVSALRKILSGLVPKRRNAAEHAVWQQKDLLFLCFWGKDNNRTIGIAHFEDKEKGLPQIKMISCAPAVEDFTQINVFEERLKYLSWVKDESNTENWYIQWTSAFVSAYREVIHTTSALTIKLAEEARKIRERILEIYDVETDKGYVHKLFKDFRNSLIHDMSKEQFADMYAQTVVYGLFSARCMDETLEDFSAKEAVDCIPITNPFLKKLMEECLGEGTRRLLTFDELEVSNVVDILLHTNTKLILRDFNRQTGGGKEDPVIHFYEEFLTAYDKIQKVQRGVFYTPQPIVNFMVRAVDSILKDEFGLMDGLASEKTKEILIDVEKKKRRVRERVPAVQILDPATGTGTFIRQTILQIYENFRKKHKGLSEKEINFQWNLYVPKHLLPRLNAFELMMAPYAVAHMKLAMVLKDTGYDFSSEQRLQVFLTNSLEEAGVTSTQMSIFDDADPFDLESVEANKAKVNNGINIVIGNPPYSGESANKGEWIMSLMEDYKKEPDGNSKLKEKNPKPVNDDYIKFIRYAQYILSNSEDGILAYINPHGFMDGPVFRGVRGALSRFFDAIYLIDLHGNANRHEVCPDNSKDENVFDIKQGVSICIFIKNKNINKKGVFVTDIWGLRDYKYDILQRSNLFDLNFEEIKPELPLWTFKKVNTDLKEKYDAGFKVDNLFSIGAVGILTARDKLNLAFSEKELSERLLDFSELSVETAREKYALGKDVRDWKVLWAQQDVKQNAIKDGVIDTQLIIPLMYRPFDVRYMLYTGVSRGLICYPRTDVTEHFIRGENIGLATGRSNKSNSCDHFLAVNKMTEFKCAERTTNSIVYPLYKYTLVNGEYVKSVNLDIKIIKKFEKSLGITYRELQTTCNELEFNERDLFYYVYGILYSNKYRKKYEQFIKSDFARIPYPNDIIQFNKIKSYGKKLVSLHTEIDVIQDGVLSSFVGSNTKVEKIFFKDDKIFINYESYFDNVEQEEWEYLIGGYQPLQKWLKDRKNNELNDADIVHFRKIILTLTLTKDIVKEIDAVLDF